jgi:hypothetical protein
VSHRSLSAAARTMVVVVQQAASIEVKCWHVSTIGAMITSSTSVMRRRIRSNPLLARCCCCSVDVCQQSIHVYVCMYGITAAVMEN